jgi:aminocarboxymuconate-semialdehyde decarboxylase
MIIDCHAHVVPPPLPAAIRAARAQFPSIAVTEEGGSLAFSFAGNKPTRPIAKPLADIEARLAWMDQNGIDRQVVGGWLDMFGYEIPPVEGAAWSRLINSELLMLAEAQPRLVPLATVPLQDGKLAAAVLREAFVAGFRGAMIGTQPKGVGGVLDDPDLAPFWEAAHSLGAIVFVHPVFESGDDRVHDYGMANAVGRITDTLIAVTRLIYAGHVVKYDGMRLVVGIGGAALPYALGRLKRNHAVTKGLADPQAALDAIWFDTLVHDPRTLRFLADTVGTQRLMLGSDMPFPIGDPAPRKTIEAAGFSAAQRQAIEGDVAARLFGL